MNRLQSQVQSHLSAVRQNTEKHLTLESKFESTTDDSISQPPSGSHKRFKSLSLPAPLSLDFSHRLFTPEHYEERYEYPLVIWLHSQDSSEYELDGVMPHLSLRNYVAIAPRAIQSSKIGQRKFCWSQTITGAAVAEDFVMQSIVTAVNELSIRPDRIFLAGYGAGGTLAQWIGLRNIETFAGVVSVNGGFPKRGKSLLQWRDARRLPVLFMHGGESTLCDTDETCRSLKNAHSSGLSYHFAQFPCGDELNTAMTDLANRFMMQIVTGEKINLRGMVEG